MRIIKAQDYTLSNGLKLIATRCSLHPIICLQLYIKAGSGYESSQTSGYAHFVEHLTFRQTGKYSGDEISALVSSWGATLNAYTDLDTTCYYILLPFEYLAQGAELLLELGFNARFSPSAHQLEKDIIREEIKQYIDDPDAAFLEWIQKDYLHDSPYQKPVLGTLTSIEHSSLNKINHY